jgi:hypothetical protein
MNLLSFMDSPRSVKVRAASVRTLLVVVCLFAASLYASASNVIFIDAQSIQTTARQQLEAVASFYGLTMEVSTVDGTRNDRALLRSLRNAELLAVVVNADALPMLNQEAFQSSLYRGDREIPLMIAGINGYTNVEVLRRWSSGVITGSERSATTRETGWYAISSGNEVTQQLGGSRLPIATDDLPYLTLSSGGGAQSLMGIRSGVADYPVFVRTVVGGHNVMFAAETRGLDIPVTPDPYRQQAVFAGLAPSMLFLRFAAAEHAWHSPGDYANFTIDDLWLREPYGHVNYEQLLRQAELHNFHATIAFIPWNFDRSQTKTTSLFREHPDRLSICVHGNNHVHQEFGPLESHPLQKQSEDMKQGLARMERFSELTQIPYDAVMVFPHSIAPEATFSELKRNHYLATVNSLNVPSDSVAPAGADFALRTATLRFGDFPSLRRYSVETDIPQAQLAIDAFLGNPMLFYAHESFFAPGIDAFDKTADLVNKLQPVTEWRGLGYIARHLYLERLRDDGSYAVRAFSSTIEIVNRHKGEATFLVEKDEDFSQPLTVLVDGRPFAYERSGSQLSLRLAIREGSASEIAIRYDNDLGLAKVDIAKNSFRTNAIRLLSDFRDNTVSNSGLGRLFIRSYAENGLKWNLALAVLMGLLVCLAGVWFARKRRKGPQAGGQILPASQPG